MNNSKLSIGEEAKNKYNELYPGFKIFGTKSLIIMLGISLILIGLNSIDIISLGKFNNIIIIVGATCFSGLIYRIGEYIGFLEGYEIGGDNIEKR